MLPGLCEDSASEFNSVRERFLFMSMCIAKPAWSNKTFRKCQVARNHVMIIFLIIIMLFKLSLLPFRSLVSGVRSRLHSIKNIAHSEANSKESNSFGISDAG